MASVTPDQTKDTDFPQAVEHFRRGSFPEAERLCREALAQNPALAACHDLLGTVLRQQGDARCVESALAAVGADPGSALFLFNLGDCYRRVNQPDNAVAVYERSLALRVMPQTLRALGTALLQLGRTDEAVQAMRKSAELEPESVLAQGRLIEALHRAGRFAECTEAGKHAMRIAPADAQIHLLAGLSHLQVTEFAEAVEALRASARLKPAAIAFSALAAAANGCGSYPQASTAAREALKLSPDDPEAHKQMGIAVQRLGYFTAAAEHLRTALAARPRDRQCMVTLATVELGRLRHAEATRLLTDASALCDGAPSIASKRIMAMNYLHDADEREIFEAHVQFGERLAQRTAGKPAGCTRTKRASDRLRIGYVSPDLCEHAVACFADALLRPVAGIDEQIVVFSDCARPDAVTRRLQSHGTTWHDTRRLNHAELAALVEREAIDILVDLAGHTSDNRLEMFALRPAAVQMTYLGYPNTTGLPREIMQYRITDAICDPIGAADALHTETLLRLPDTFLCYRAPTDAPAVAEPPCVRNGFVTFGCFSNIAKLSWETLGEWAELLREVPRSRLMLKNHSLMDEPLCESIRRFFNERGVDASRIELVRGEPSYADHLARYHEVDIALDTYPYNGTTTICEALWMGVPVVSHSGSAHRSRVGKSILRAVGLETLASDSVGGFAIIADELSRDVGRRITLRQNLRDRMALSALMNRGQFRANLSVALRTAAPSL